MINAAYIIHKSLFCQALVSWVQQSDKRETFKFCLYVISIVFGFFGDTPVTPIGANYSVNSFNCFIPCMNIRKHMGK